MSAAKQVILGAYFPGVNHDTVWSDPASGSHIDFASFEHWARTAERGKLDLLFLAEGLRLRTRGEAIFDQDVVGRPDTFTVLASLAAITEHVGLAGTINSTFNEPYELARKFATLDLLSGGRAAWNVVTSSDAPTGENFRRGGFLHPSQRYERAGETLAATRRLWDSWGSDAVVADQDSGRFLRDEHVGDFSFRGEQFDIAGRFSTPRSPQGHPVVLQAGESPAGRDFAAANSDAIFSRYQRFDEARAFYTDVKARVRKAGRDPDEVKILPSAAIILGDTEADARDRHADIRSRQVDPFTSIVLAEMVWNRDLSDVDPDGPVPDLEPTPDAPKWIKGRAPLTQDAHATAEAWRELGRREGLTLRQVVTKVFDRNVFVGTPASVAAEIDRYVREEAVDGFILGSHVSPSGLDEVVDRVVPLLQDRGVFRTEYTGTTLRDNLGLAPASRFGEPRAAG
ncbi:MULTISPECIES: NtaA/DmoA family FMN-dependent monooxygenase [unclassified Saccharopolyspora]|uniref:NtaA/DmoA family FMN-dependent monooxygenase n=1 Tax=unclassified Saccharopolyspora TaxID=2646250 RepID=UPI001CD6DD09|nr:MULTISPECIES: NtaA/DmoA family FMN-dependent monooxygenase [unclassified Saccharopolyspora]MCA1186758.1 NtaA/DmoA family FMN-dependent monooxygenase [Saccharopolyspora sp. 6T]MCA1193002.1 NtaA/DmoA family FMN-dependent monooxygenase [Saccharopolyspora sp. 6V]MCA1226580.1 NtaA/DmoA family FMN-dependent monooxygenase [Saccharopolyspora sp. 6M]MCA1282003.1 NtaA/DmoA family FMN-dependent monooxygenase [Saccharopolyspora sp. 7B]